MWTHSNTLFNLIYFLVSRCQKTTTFEKSFNMENVLGLVYQSLQVAIFSQLKFTIIRVICCVFRRWKTFENCEKVPFPSFARESLSITDQQTFFFIFLHASNMSLSCTWWKSYFFHHFLMIFIVFDHTNACASICLLVKIHNSYHFHVRLCATFDIMN